MTRSMLSPHQDDAARKGLRLALDAGASRLREGGKAIDAVEAAVRVLEDDPNFNAGRGSVFTAEGRVECDAAIMDGIDRKAGAVAGIRSTRNPITSQQRNPPSTIASSIARSRQRRTAPNNAITSLGSSTFGNVRGVRINGVPTAWPPAPVRRVAIPRGTGLAAISPHITR